jgi:hypothetical protein
VSCRSCKQHCVRSHLLCSKLPTAAACMPHMLACLQYPAHLNLLRFGPQRSPNMASLVVASRHWSQVNATPAAAGACTPAAK